MVTISKNHPEIDIDDDEIQKVLLIFNLLIGAESDKISNGQSAEDKITYSYKNCSKITSTFAQQYRPIKTSWCYKKCIKK